MCEDVNVKISGSSCSRKIYLSAEDVLQVLYNKQVLNLSAGKIKSNFTFSLFFRSEKQIFLSARSTEEKLKSSVMFVFLDLLQTSKWLHKLRS